MNHTNLIEHYFQKYCQGMDFSEIRKELLAHKLSDEGFRFVLNSIDNKILQEEKDKVSFLKGRETFFIGLALLVIGLFITIGSYGGLIKMQGKYIFASGPMISGLLLMWSKGVPGKEKENKFGRFRK